MYLVGGEHPYKTESQILAKRLVAEGQHLVTDAEVLQEILHRYISIDRRNTIGRAFQVLLDMVDDVFPVEKTDVLRAAEIAQNRASFSARDAVHIAVMEHQGIQTILSFDADFDRWPGLKRIHGI
jgi:predicted nucleic acid-binding protein